MVRDEWHLSKSVPVTFILAIVGQTVALVWFVASMNSGIQNNAEDIIRNDTRLTKVEGIMNEQAVTLARMDENIKAIRSLIERSVDMR